MMQTWIESEFGRLFVLDYDSVQLEFKSTILIISGFGEASCDKECFMSKLARHLQKQSYRVFQADIYGHGESSGNINDISIDRILSSVNSISSYIFRICGTYPIVISRGIIGTIISDNLINDTYQICLNPYYPNPNIARRLLQLIQNKQISFDILLEGYCRGIEIDNFYKRMIVILSELGIFHQHKLSVKFVTEILQLLPATFNCCICLETNDDKTGVKIWSPAEGYRMSEDYDRISLKEDAVWQYAAFESITQILNKRSIKSC